MQRAMAAEAEATRDARAKVRNAKLGSYYSKRMATMNSGLMTSKKGWLAVITRSQGKVREGR